jgi:hypothetical protein
LVKRQKTRWKPCAFAGFFFAPAQCETFAAPAHFHGIVFHPLGRKRMFLGLFGILLLAWLISFVVLHVSSGLIHLLLLFAVASFIVHLFTGKSSASA